MIAAVYDCMIYVQAALSSQGASFACLNLAEDHHVTLYLCPVILDEIKSTLERPGFRRKYSKLTDQRVANFLSRITSVGKLLPDPGQTFTLARDPKDEPYLNLAIAAPASYLVSRDKDLLSLKDDAKFGVTCPHLTILEPAAFLAHARAQIAAEQNKE